jgi:hypothetical protein
MNTVPRFPGYGGGLGRGQGCYPAYARPRWAYLAWGTVAFVLGYSLGYATHMVVGL